MRGIKAIRCSIKIGNLWESPMLHILITKEEEIYVARCLDFTVSSHGDSPKEALEAVKLSIVEYIHHAFENNITNLLIDPTPNRYWDIFKEAELKAESIKIRKTVNSLNTDMLLQIQQIPEEMMAYA